MEIKEDPKDLVPGQVEEEGIVPDLTTPAVKIQAGVPKTGPAPGGGQAVEFP